MKKTIMKFLGLAVLCGVGLNALAANVVGYVYKKQIITSEGVQLVTATNGFSTLKAALESKDSFGKTLTLFADVATGACVIDGSDDKNGHYASHKKITLDLNGHNITCANSMAKDKYNNTDKNGVFCLSGGIDFELTGQGTVECTMEGGRIVHCFDNTGITFTVGKGVTLISDYNFAYIQARHDDWDTRYDAATDGTTINVSGKVSVVGSKFIDLLISTDAGIQNLNINLFDGAQLITPTCSDWHFNIPSGVTGSLNVYPGSRIHSTQHYAAEFAIASSQFKINITGGYFGNKTVWHDDKPIPLPEGYAFYPTSVSYCLYQVCPISTAKVGEKYYVTLQDAVDNAAAGSLVELIANIDENVVLPADKAFVLKGGDYVMDGGFSGEGDIEIRSGVFTFDPKEYAASSAEVIENETDPVTYSVVNYTAMVGETKYGSFAKALDAAKALGTATVVMIGDDDLGGTGFSIESGKDITIDLNGKDLIGSAADLFTVKGGGKLVLTDTSAEMSGTFTHTGSYDFADNSGTIVVKGGTYNVKNYGISYQNGGSTLLIEGGCLNYVNGTRTVFTAGGTGTVSGGVIYGTLPACTVTGGAFDHDPSAFLAAGYCAVKGESLWEVLVEAKLDGVVSGADAAVVNAHGGSVIEFIAGTATTTKVLAGGETLTLINAEGHYDYANLVKGASACDLAYDTSENTVTITSTLNTGKCQAKIVDADGNEVYYGTFADAVKAAESGATVSVAKDIALTAAETEGLVVDKDVTIDLAGLTIAAPSKDAVVLTVKAGTCGVVDFVGGGIVSGQIVVEQGAKLEIFAGTFDSDPSAYVATGLVARADDPAVGPWTVGKPVTKVEEIKPEAVKVDETAMADIPPEKQDEAQQAVEKLVEDIQKSFTEDPVVAATQTHAAEIVKENQGKMVQAVFAAAEAQGKPLSAEEKQQVADNIAKFAEGTADTDTTEYLHIETKAIAAKPVVVPVAETVEVKAQADKLVYEVEPIFETVTVKTDADGNVSVDKTIPVVMSNEDVEKNPVTFSLEVFNQKATQALVFHHSEDPKYPDETFTCPIWEKDGHRYITITASHFSTFEITYSEAVYTESEGTIGILKIEKDGTDVVAAAVPFVAESFDALVTTGAQTGDEVSSDSVELGAPFWFSRASDNGVPLTLAGLVADIPAKTVASGSPEEPTTTLLVNPNRTEANLLAELSGTIAAGDEIALAGDDVRYVFKDGAWSLVTKGNDSGAGATAVYGDDRVTPVTSITVDGSRAAWYVSKGGNPTVTWADGSVDAEFVNGAEGAMTYGAADWEVSVTPFESDTFPYSYVRFVCDAGGVTFDGDKTGDKTVFLGADGFDWGEYDPEASEFWVALLNDNKDVIAVSQTRTFDELKAANALDLNYTGDVAPLAATAKAAFGGFTVPDDGEYDALTNAFEGVAKVSVDRDGEGNFVYTVKLSSDVTGPVSLADNLGKVTIDLNGHSISGTVATAAADAGNAIVIDGSLADAANKTALLVKNTGAAGAAIVGGRGADGVYAKDGAVAIAYDSEAGVTVDDPDSLVSAGANGVTETAWAWCLCDTTPADPVDLPYGVSFEEATGKYHFWGHDEKGAKFDFADIAGWDVTDDTIHFVDGEIKVSGLTVSSDAPDTLKFVGGAETVLKAQGDASIFDVTAGDAQVRTWEKLGFTCEAEKTGAEIAQCGGAICMKGGRMTVADCDFCACTANENGGAIAAISLAANSLVTNSVFAGNMPSEGNGYGGAIYATAKTNGLKLSVVDSTFAGNAAENGGAIAVYPANIANEKPIALVVRNGEFANNYSWGEGGAIVTFGDVEVEAGTTEFNGNFATFAGGAVAVTSYGGDTTTAEVKFGRGVSFIGNVVSNDSNTVMGGAVAFDAKGGTFSAEGVAFVGNAAKSGWETFGGALDVSFCANAAVDTCVFDDNEVVALDGNDKYFYGAAICAMGGDAYSLSAKNSTFRRSDTEAIYVSENKATVKNCVVVDNGGTDYADIAVYDSALDLSYTAYGTLETEEVELTESNNLADRDADIYAGADTLKLRETGINLVASLGLVQTANDFEGTPYGSKPAGYAMGAYEAAQTPITVTLNGDKVYDGEANSNGCEWTWSLSTNGVPVDDTYCAPDIADVKTAFEIVAWQFGDKKVGFYASTNETATVLAELSGCEQFRAALEFVYQGKIKRSPAELVIVVDPEDNRWNDGQAIKPSVKVYDPFTEQELVEGTDYVFHYEGNTDPTAEAKVVVDALGDYVGVSSTNFWITAFKVVSTFDGVADPSLTYYTGATGEEAVVVSDVIDCTHTDYCFDWQNSVTNGTARKVDHADGMLVITMQYCTDANNDTVPDKYQKKLPVKVVNGTWDATDGYDKTAWVTLEKDGKWDVTGTGLATVPVVTSGKAATGYTKSGAGWLAFKNGKFTVVDPATFGIGNDTAFLLYSYLRLTDSGHAAGGRGGRGGTETTYTLEDMYRARLAITSFSMSGNMLTLGTKLTITDNTANDKKVVDGPLADTMVKIEWSKTPGGEAEEVFEPMTDSDGNATFAKPDADSAFFKLAE